MVRHRGRHAFGSSVNRGPRIRLSGALPFGYDAVLRDPSSPDPALAFQYLALHRPNIASVFVDGGLTVTAAVSHRIEGTGQGGLEHSEDAYPSDFAGSPSRRHLHRTEPGGDRLFVLGVEPGPLTWSRCGRPSGRGARRRQLAPMHRSASSFGSAGEGHPEHRTAPAHAEAICGKYRSPDSNAGGERDDLVTDVSKTWRHPTPPDRSVRGWLGRARECCNAPFSR